MIGYLVVLSYGEEETYFFKDKKSMFKFWKVNSIDELIQKESDLFTVCYVYKISHVWSSTILDIL